MPSSQGIASLSKPTTPVDGGHVQDEFPDLLAIVISNVALADVVRRGSLPDSSWGVWTTTDPNHVSVDLSAKTYADSEENCVVNWVSETPGASGPIYSAHLQCSLRSDRGGKSFGMNLVIWPKARTRSRLVRDLRASRSFILVAIRAPDRRRSFPRRRP